MLKAWIAAFRLKTLPLALGAIIIGSWLPSLSLEIEIFGFATLTAILLQILSNLANDYGDYMKGTDKHRSDRQLGGGHLKPRSMKLAILVFVLLALASGIALLNSAFSNNWIHWLQFFGLGILAISAAIAYTVGKNAYGYYGLGDLFVFLFFGLVGVVATSFLYDTTLEFSRFLAGISYGALCVGVLNVNNIRDLDKDVLSNKITLAAKLGKENALNYQAFILILAFAAMFGHHLVTGYKSLAPIAIAVIGYNHMTALRKAETSRDYNLQLRNLSLGSLAVALLFMLELHI